MPFLRLAFLSLFVLLMLVPTARAVEATDMNWLIGLESALGEGERRGEAVQKSLELYLNLSGGEVAAGAGWAPNFNRAAHRVTGGAMRVEGERFDGELTVEINPDRWVPEGGRQGRMTVRVEGTLGPALGDVPSLATLSGRYSGTYDGREIEGPLSGRVWERSTPAGAVLTGRLFPEKPDGRDYPEMEVSVGLAGGEVRWAQMGMSWNRWPGRFFELDPSMFTWDAGAQTLTGEMTVPARAIDVASEPGAEYRLRWDGAYVGGLFATRVTATPVGDAAEGEEALPTLVYNGGGRVSEAEADAAEDVGDVGVEPRNRAGEFAWMFETDREPWYLPVKQYKPVEPNEHPRLLFRKGDIDALREKAATPEGQQIVARLRKLLDGGDGTTIPENFNQTPPHNHNHSDLDRPVGSTFTSFHAPGYAMLYQLTGEQRYADLSRRSVELMFDGAIDRDNRYAWAAPGTDMRVGSLLMSVALAYDLAFDGWDADFRERVALELQNYDKTPPDSETHVTVERLMGRTGYPPASNHYGSQFGGSLVAMLAIRGDTGVDHARVDKRVREGLWMIPHFFHHAFGEGGWYQEGPHPSRLSTNGGLVLSLQAVRNAYGRDYITPRPNGQFATLRWVYWLTRFDDGHPRFLNRGTYGDDRMYGRAPMLSHSADFAFGFGAVDDRYKPAVLWTYHHFVKTWDEGNKPPSWATNGEPTFNSFVYPMHAAVALVNWPVGVEPINPAEVLPHHHVDRVNDFFVSRREWDGPDDIIVTFSTGGGPWGYHRPQNRGQVHLLAFGQKVELPGRFGHHRPTAHAWGDDGSFSLSLVSNFFAKQHTRLAVDLTGKSGAALVILQEFDASEEEKISGGKKREYKNIAVRETVETTGDRVLHITTIDREATPDVTIGDDGTVRVGEQTYTSDGGLIEFPGLDHPHRPGDR